MFGKRFGLVEIMVNNWQADLLCAARDAGFECGSVEAIGDEAHGQAAIALLRAFQQDASCAVFAEARTPGRGPHENARPADLLLLHPEIGVLFVEVKGWTLAQITGIVAGTIHRRVNEGQESKNPWKQVEDAALQLQKATGKVLRRRRIPAKEAPFFDGLVAFPNITRASWHYSGYGESFNPGEVLFREDLAEPRELRTLLVQRSRAKAGYRLPCSRSQLENVRWALGDSAVINRRGRKEWKQGQHQENLSGRIDRAELRRKRFTPEQRELIEAEFDGRPQLVRGVAGSEVEAPGERFLIVCYNQTLVPLLRRQVEEAFLELTHRKLPDCVTIAHINKLEYTMCRDSGRLLQYQSWDKSGGVGGEDRAAHFAENYCKQLDSLSSMDSSTFHKLQYDSIYVDEGQDLFAEEYRLLMKLLRPDEKTGEHNIVIFYDDAQNLYGRPRPVWAELGIEIRGRAALMRTCLRNPRQIVEFAFNLLLGVAADTRVATKQFAETRFLAMESLVEELPDRWLVHFAAREDGQLPEVALFPSRLMEIEWILARLSLLIQEQGVRPEDILLVAEKPQLFAARLEEQIRRKLPKVEGVFKPWGRKEGHKRNLDKEKYLLQKGHLTLATVKAAKGYDCPIVLLVGSDLFPGTMEGRASFYVAATRATMRLFVSGLRTPGTLAVEAESVAALLVGPVPEVEVVPVTPREEQSSPSLLLVDTEIVQVRSSRTDRAQPGGEGIVQAVNQPIRSGWKQLLSRALRR